MKQTKTITKTKVKTAVEIALVVLATGSMAAGIAFSTYKNHQRYQNDNSVDINRDGKINEKDLKIVNDSWNNTNCPVYGCCLGANNRKFDCNLNDDNNVDIIDIQMVASKISNKNSTCGLCKQIASPPADWCKGGRIISGGKDKCGCEKAPICDQKASTDV